MLYAALAIIVAGIGAAITPILREWASHRKRKAREDREREASEREDKGRR